MNFLKIILISLILPISLTAQSNTYSYIYIEGDKETSFYVKLEGKMMPRLGQHYSILSNLDAGVTNIEILFQQNKYPAQQYKINVPKNSVRSFVLRKTTDTDYALYDLLNNYIIPNGNRAEDDKYTPPPPVVTKVENTEENPIVNNTNNKDNNETIPEFNPAKKEKEVKEKVVKEKEVKEKEVKEKIVKEKKEPKEKEPKEKKELNIFKPKEKEKILTQNNNDTFIENIVFDPNQEKKKIETKNTIEKESEEASPTTTECTEAMSNEAFEDFALVYLEKSDDNSKLKFLKNSNKKCFNSEQVRILATNLQSTSARYEAAELLLKQTTDKSQYYYKLEGLFRTDFFKNKLKQLTGE